MSDIDEKAKDIVAKDSRLAPLTKAATPSKDGPWWALKNSAGKKDVAMTLMIVSFVFSLLLAALGAVENINLGERSFNFRAFDMGFATTVLIPLVGLYFGRRWTDTQRGLYDQQLLAIAGQKKTDEDNLEQPE